jgi:hypothetical protein
LEQALHPKRDDVSIYRGHILEFVEGRVFKEPKPIKINKINGGSEMDIVGAIVIDKEDYWPLSDYFLNKLKKKTLSSLENYVISQYPQRYRVLVEKGRLNNVILGDYPKEMIKEIPKDREYLKHLILLPSRFRVDDIPDSTMNRISSNLKYIQDEIQSSEYILYPVSQEVTSMKQLFINKKPSEYYVVMSKNRYGNPELYLIREPFNGLFNVDIDNKGIVKETSATRDNLEMGQNQIVQNDALILWKGNKLVIEGNFREAQRRYSYKGVPLVGLLV